MKIKIQAHDVELTDDLRAHVERRLSTALGAFGDQVDHVVVRLSDTNGDGKKGDKLCQIVVRLQPSVRVQEADADLFAVVDRLCLRAARAVTQAIERNRE
jgi:ribosomal subunit interface protein